MSSDFSLSFLEDLKADFTDKDVEEAWHGRFFPLVCTDDFTQNWRIVLDPGGIFATPAGLRCGVQPQTHHEQRCKALIYEDGRPQQSTLPYEAIIFAKIIRQKYLSHMTAPEHDSMPRQPQVERRQYIDKFVRKLPTRWRSLATQCDLHLYDEQSSRKSRSTDTGLYSTLAKPENIRLLSLLPCNDPSAQIECTLCEADLAANPDYEALSYVWGSPTPQRSIVLNGKSFSVGENLEAALRQLRPCGETSVPRTMWIDAVCINQSDIEERTQQVSQMDTVYRSAAQVVVWLGRESNTSDRLFKALNSVSKDDVYALIRLTPEILDFPFGSLNHNTDGAEARPVSTLKDLQHKSKETDSLNTGMQERIKENTKMATDPRILPYIWTQGRLGLFEGYTNLLRRSWWNRVWVLQEAILAKKVTLHCGSGSVDWPIFQAGLFSMLSGSKYRQMVTGESKAHLQLLLESQGIAVFLLLQNAFLDDRQTALLTMSKFLSFTSDFEATDARDRVFALFGLLPEASHERSFFKPDYITNVRQLFIRVAKYFLTTTQRLDIVTAKAQLPPYVRPRPGHDPNIGEPSWVPNWNLPQIWTYNTIWISQFSDFEAFSMFYRDQIEDVSTDVTQHTRTEEPCLFKAGLHESSPFSFEFSAFDEILHVRGIAVDEIEEVGTAMDLGLAMWEAFKKGDPYTCQKMLEAQVAMVEKWKLIARAETESIYPFTQQTSHEAFWRTLLLNRCRHQLHPIHVRPRLIQIPSKRTKQEVSNLFGSGLQAFPPSNKDDEKHLMLYMMHEATEMWNFGRVNLHCANLSFFRTVKGYIGVTHPNARPGDTVAVLLGAAVPLVLRSYPEGHTIIGQSYVHGIMNGEIIQAEIDRGRGRRKEDFTVFNII